MKIIVDTNILFSFFRENPVRFIILNSSSYNLELFTPEYSIEELNKNKSELMKYSGLKSYKDFELALKTLNLFIGIKPMEFFKEFRAEAIKTSPDLKDSPFFALALKLNAAIWSNEPGLKSQSAVKIFSTRDLRTLLGI